MNGITEWLANLSTPVVITVIVVLVGLRFALIKQGSAAAKSVAETAESLAIALGLVFLIIRPFFVQAFFIPSESMVPTLLVRDHILVNKTVYLLGDPKRGDVVVFKAPPEALKNLEGNPEFANGKVPQTDFIKRCIAVPGDEVYVTGGYIVADGKIRTHGDLHDSLATKVPIRIMSDGLYIDGERQDSADIASRLKTSANIEYHPGQVFINGKAIKDSYINEDPDWNYPMLKAPANQFGQTTSDAERIVKILNDAVADGKFKLINGKGHTRVKLGPNEYLMMGDNRNNSSDGRFWGPLDRDRVVGRAMFIFFPFNRISWVR